MASDIYTHLGPELLTGGIAPVQSRGSGENLRLYVTQVPHSAVKPVMGRDVILVLDPVEALALARALVGSVPALQFENEPEKVAAFSEVYRLLCQLAPHPKKE